MKTENIEKAVDGMNNFWTKLPDDHYDSIPGVPLIRSGPMRVSKLESGSLDQAVSVSKPDSHSSYYLSQTPRDFFRIIDDLVIQLGISSLLIECLESIWDPKYIEAFEKANEIDIGDSRIPYEIRAQALEERNKLSQFKRDLSIIALPVFLKMIENGYYNYDLSI